MTSLTKPARPRSYRWVGRALLAVVVVVFAYVSVTSTLAQVAVKGNPAAAHQLAPGSGHITAALAQQQFANQLQAEPDSPPAGLAKLALRQDPTAVEALNVLGFQAQLRGDAEEAGELFGYSHQLSRRELRSQMWGIEEAIGRGDIAGALLNYDIALRTSARAQELLFPVLAAALAEPQIRSHLLEIMRRQPAWGESFIGYVATSGVDPEAGLQYFRAHRQAGLEIGQDWNAGLVNALFAQGDYSDAWAYYTSFRSNAERGHSRDPGFELDAGTRTPFDWNVSEEGRHSVAILSGEQGGLVDFAVSPGTGGVLLSQMQLLPPGTYNLQGRSRAIEQPQRSRPYWTLTCLDGREIGRVALPASVEDAPFSGQFSVPRNCPVQTLALVARPADTLGGVTGQIEHVQLSPAARGNSAS